MLTYKVVHVRPKVHLALTKAAVRLSKELGRRVSIKEVVERSLDNAGSKIPELEGIYSPDIFC
jgi:hypothetical protein